MAGRKRRTPENHDPITAYARSVVANEVIAGRLVRLACERHLSDLEIGAERGLHFDLVTAQRAIDFFPMVLRHSKGRHAGEPFELLPWQQFVVGSLFGWKLGTTRRFRTAFVSTGARTVNRRSKLASA